MLCPLSPSSTIPPPTAEKSGSLITPDSSHPDLTIVAVSHDRPGELPSGGEINLWGALEERLRSPWQGVEAVLHLGGQVRQRGDAKVELCGKEVLIVTPLERVAQLVIPHLAIFGTAVCLTHVNSFGCLSPLLPRILPSSPTADQFYPTSMMGPLCDEHRLPRRQVDLSNAFEDGKACLEVLEERRKAGKVSEGEEASTMRGLKERFREEYRKVNICVRYEKSL